MNHTGVAVAVAAAWPAQPTFYAPLKTSLVLARGVGDPTFTRATTATVFDYEGVLKTAISGEFRSTGERRVRNLAPNSEDFTGFAAYGTPTSVVVDATDYPVGAVKSTAITADASYEGVDFTGLVVGRAYTVTVSAKGASGQFVFSNGVADLLTIAATSGWVAYSVTFTASQNRCALLVKTSGATLRFSKLQFEDVTGQTNQNPSEYVNVGVLPAPFHGANVDGVKYFDTENGNTVVDNVVIEAQGAPIPDATLAGYFAEGSRTNLFTYSADLTNAAGWTANSCTVANTGALATDGATTMGRITATNAGNRVNSNGALAVSAAAAYTVSYEVAAGSSNYAGLVFAGAGGTPNSCGAIFDLTGAGTVVGTTGTGSPSARIRLLTTGRYLIELTHTTGAGQTGCEPGVGVSDGSTYSFGVYPSATSGTVDATFAQCEAGASASSRILTTSAAVTRNADVEASPAAGNISAAAGTISLEFTPQHAPSGTIFLWASYIDVSNYTALLHDATNLIFRKRVAGTNYDATIANAFVSGTTYQVAASWGAAGSSIVLDGVVGTPHANTTAAQIGSTMQIGSDGNGLQQPFAALEDARIWQRQLSDATLQRMTA